MSFAARRHASTTAAAPDLPGEIFKRSKHNKEGLSKVLDDVTMRSGEHDMRVFGTGTLAALKSKSAYISFAASHYHFYNELENRLDDAHRENTRRRGGCGDSSHPSCDERTGWRGTWRRS